MNRHGILILTATAMLIGSTLHAAPDRGLWFWGSTTLPGGAASSHGSDDVVGNIPEENAALAFMSTYGVTRVYGSYGPRPVSELATIAAWNAKLNAAGIDSQLLIEATAVDDPAHILSLLNKITTRLIDFNDSVGATSKFDALHLDIEPQQLASWSTPANKRALLSDLAAAYAAIRSHLDDAGFNSLPIYADINFSWDKLPDDGGSVGWADASDRDAWYAGLGADLDGLTIMTFSKTTAPALATATAFERSGVFPGTVVVGMQPRTGVGQTWPNHTSFYSVMSQLETDIGTAEATDIENYAFWRHAVATFLPTYPALPQIHTLAEVNGGGGTGGVIVVHVRPGYKYVFEENDDLSQASRWSEVKTFTTDYPDRIERFEHPVPMKGPRNFWRISRSPVE